MPNNNVGYVYVLSNKGMPNLYKIGCTSRHPSERAEELYSTGNPYHYDVKYYIKINNYESLEKYVHRELNEYNVGKEWFEIDIPTIIETIHKLNKSKIYDEFNYIPKTPVEIKQYNNDYILKKQKEIENEIHKLNIEKQNYITNNKPFLDVVNDNKIFGNIIGIIFLAAFIIGFMVLWLALQDMDNGIVSFIIFFIIICGAVKLFTMWEDKRVKNSDDYWETLNKYDESINELKIKLNKYQI